MRPPSAKVLRICAALCLVGSALAAGYLGRSPWMILWLGLAFSVSYAIGKWPAWQAAWRNGGLRAVLFAIPSTYVIQCGVVSVLFWVGSGMAMLLGVAHGGDPAAWVDVWAALGVGGVTACLGVWILRLERTSGGASLGADDVVGADFDDDLDDEDQLGSAFSEPELGDLLTGPMTIETFYSGASESRTAAVASPELIEATEARLKVSLPPLLKELYREQNGGELPSYFVPVSEEGELVGWRGVFGHGSHELLPLAELHDYTEHHEYYFNPYKIPTAPLGAEKWIVLAWYRGDCTFLDYSEAGSAARGEPAVVVRNFDPEEEPTGPDVRYPSFDAFFAALRKL